MWKDIEGFKGLYQINELGEVKSLGRFVNNRGFPDWRGERILKPRYYRGGYTQVSLCKDNKIYTKKVHRLVAEAFIPNPNNLPEVNHRNRIRDDNRVENLEWCTREYNSRYSLAKKVAVYDLKYNLIGIFESAKEAAEFINIDRSNISRCCNNSTLCHKKYYCTYV